MISLGAYDPEVQSSALGEYLDYAHRVTGVEQDWKNQKKLRGERDDHWVAFEKATGNAMKVAEVQRFLKDAGFFPLGKIDGICGYRTAASIRLFQEYVRTVENDSGIGFPDGKLGPNSFQHIKRWQAAGKKADWTAFSGANPSREFSKWMNLLGLVKQKYLANPNPMLRKVKQFAQTSDTVNVANWDLDPNKIHMIGIRRHEARPGVREFDDVFVLLINGLAFKFYGSTEPGYSQHPAGPPFLTLGQHIYRFGWHKLSDLSRVYHGLKPMNSGVLVVRSSDMLLTDADLSRPLERNNSINVHWGGEGETAVGNWSEGCQVIVGEGYINHNDHAINCSKFAARNYSTLGQVVEGAYQTRGAYTMLADIVTAFSGGEDNTVKYMLLSEKDLDLNPEIGLAAAREALDRIESLS